MHQLHKREAAAAVQPHHVHPGTGGVPARGHQVKPHRFWARPAALYRPDGETCKTISLLLAFSSHVGSALRFFLALCETDYSV